MSAVKWIASLFFLVLGCGLRAGAQEAKPNAMRLWQGKAPMALGTEANDIPTVTIYLPPADKTNGAALVICPGGGYHGLAMDHEGHQIARWANSLGMAGIILRYRLAPRYHHPVPMLDAQRAMRFTRAHAKEWGIDPKRVGIIGFSAGGHLASTVGTHFDAGQSDPADRVDRFSSRPDFMVLLYPVITMKDPHTHRGSRTGLLGKNPDPALIESLSNESQVTKDTPPTFLAHTSEDTAVPAANSVLFYVSLSKAKVPAEMHIYEKGRHGLGLGPRNMAFSSWPGHCATWLRLHGFIGAK
jgi:acetyl esterase/lipase